MSKLKCLFARRNLKVESLACIARTKIAQLAVQLFSETRHRLAFFALVSRLKRFSLHHVVSAFGNVNRSNDSVALRCNFSLSSEHMFLVAMVCWRGNERKFYVTTSQVVMHLTLKHSSKCNFPIKSFGNLKTQLSAASKLVIKFFNYKI